MNVRLGGMGVVCLSKWYSNLGCLVMRMPHDAKYLWKDKTEALQEVGIQNQESSGIANRMLFRFTGIVLTLSIPLNKADIFSDHCE